MPDVSVRVEELVGHPNTIILYIGGDLDATNFGRVANEFKSLLQQQYINFIVDLGTLEYINSTAMGVLITYNRNVKERGGKLFLVNVQSNVYTMLEIVGAHNVLRIFNTIKEASKVLDDFSSK